LSTNLFGLGRQKPHHYVEMARIAWENRDQWPFAWRILRNGVCDGCALGTSGLSDWTLAGTHLCMVRLELMRLNTAPALDSSMLANVAALSPVSSRSLRGLGRLPHPMMRRAGEAGFRQVSWDAALDRIADELRTADPRRFAMYLTSRGLTNEVYYAAQKFARFVGTNHVDNAARLCHAASTVAMKEMLGHGASTCSYVDWLRADLIVFFGSNVPNNQPVTTKYLFHAKKNGARIAVVNPHREPGLERYWIPSIAESALSGTPLADDWYDVHTGGDLAFLTGALRALVELGGVDEQFVAARTVGFEDVRRAALGVPWDQIEAASGATRARIEDFARLLMSRPNTIFVWSMGLTQHAHGVDTIRALINVALARGLPVGENRGLVPIRGHSGVQGGAEVGCVPTIDARMAARWQALWRFPVPQTPGWTTTEMVDRASRGEVGVFWLVGGNFLETLPDRAKSTAALRTPRLRVHQDIVVSSSMLAGCDGDVIALPATTRYESPGGGTETSTERRIIFSPEVPGRRIGSAKPEWWVFREVARRLRAPDGNPIGLEDAQSIRNEIGAAIPLYAGIEALGAKGDAVQWGGRTLYADGRFATADGKARFVRIPGRAGYWRGVAESGSRLLDKRFSLSTRRGKQFNSMVQREIDPLTGASRDDILISTEDLSRLGVDEGRRVRLRSESGAFTGTLRAAPIKPGNLQVHWPEGNVLLGANVDPDSHEPDYNTTVTVEVSLESRI
jgi:molybdopterin-dependent oxidoreductase alpha subunit